MIVNCSQCTSRYFGHEALEIHIKQKHKRNVLICDFCNKIFHKKCSLYLHLMKFHRTDEPEVLCEYCPKLFHAEKQMQMHVARYHRRVMKRQKRLVCEDCKETFKTKRTLQRHQRQACKFNLEAKIYNKPYRCELCNLKFVAQDTLKRHIKYCKFNENRQRIKCEKCHKDFSRLNVLRLHMERFCKKRYCRKKKVKTNTVDEIMEEQLQD